MDALSISAAGGMRARLESLELIANNLANAATQGYKADREFYGLYRSAAALDAAGGPQAAVLPVIEKNWIDFSQGTLEPSANPLSLALEGRGFFTIDTPRGTLYTRNGDFRLDAAGVLVNADGHPVRTREEPLHRLVLDPLDPSPVEVRADGAVWRNGSPVGTLELADLPSSEAEKRHGGYFRLATGAVAGSASPQVHQARIERSNTSPAESAVRLISVMRQFEMLQRAVSVGVEMNRRATDEVARAGS